MLPGPQTKPDTSPSTRLYPLEVPQGQLTSLLVFLLSEEDFVLFHSPPCLFMLVMR